MPNVVTFDPARLLIIEIPVYVDESPTPSPQTMADNEISMQEIYSEAKEYFAGGYGGSPSTGGLGLPPAIRYIGGDPISESQDAGITYFMTNGWRIKPAEGDHKLTIVGNVFTDPAGQSIFARTDGPFNVNTETRVSNLVDSSVARLDLTQVLQAVFIDTINGVAGTGTIAGTQIGTPTLPVNNITDARAIADRDNLRGYQVRGEITLDQDYSDWNFKALAAARATTIDMGGQRVNGSQFTGCTLKGSTDGTSTFEAEACGLALLTAVAGIFRDCGFQASVTLIPGTTSQFFDCESEIPYEATPKIFWNGAKSARWSNYSGGLEICDMGAVPLSPESDLPTCSVDLDPGTLKLGPTNVAGLLKVRGVGECDDTMGSPSVIVDDSELVKGSDLQLARKLLQNRTHTNPSTGIMTVYDDDDSTVLLQGDLFEDVNATQRYRGQGAERRDRLV